MDGRLLIRHAVVVVAVLGTAGLLLFGIIKASQQSPPSSLGSVLIVIGTPIALAILSFFVRPVREEIEVSFSHLLEALNGNVCRVFLFGRSRSGKTTLAADLVAVNRDAPKSETQLFVYYKLKAPINLDDGRYIKLKISDYRGQDPSQVLVDHDPLFFGPRGRRRINVLLFLVDLFPEERDASGNVLSDEALVESYRDNAEEMIARRVESHCRYLSPEILSMVFTLCFSRKNLCAVRLAINKIDLLEALVDKEYVTLPVGMTVTGYAEKQYEGLYSTLQRFCAENGIASKLDRYCISAAQGKNTGRMFADVFKAYGA